MLCAHFTQKTLYEVRYVLLMVAQWRHMNVEHIQPIIEGVGKITPGQGPRGHLIGCAQDENVHCGFHLAAQTAQLAVFEHAQELGLSGDRHLADFIQQQGSTFCQLKASGSALERPGESTFLMTENFTLNQSFWNRGAVD